MLYQERLIDAGYVLITRQFIRKAAGYYCAGIGVFNEGAGEAGEEVISIATLSFFFRHEAGC